MFSVLVQGRYYSGGEGRGDYVVMIKTKKGKPILFPPIACDNNKKNL